MLLWQFPVHKESHPITKYVVTIYADACLYTRQASGDILFPLVL